eukprot:362076-Rhodomonas_salina.2
MVLGGGGDSGGGGRPCRGQGAGAVLLVMAALLLFMVAVLLAMAALLLFMVAVLLFMAAPQPRAVPCGGLAYWMGPCDVRSWPTGWCYGMSSADLRFAATVGAYAAGRQLRESFRAAARTLREGPQPERALFRLEHHRALRGRLRARDRYKRATSYGAATACPVLTYAPRARGPRRHQAVDAPFESSVVSFAGVR